MNLRGISCFNPLASKPSTHRQASVTFARIPRQMPDTLNTHIYDVVIIGGGANGTALFRELAVRGASVLLLDKNNPDRPSRNNSHLAHSLRYLANGELGLVWSGRQATQILLNTAKHLVKPLQMLIPIDNQSQYGHFKTKIGMLFYDLPQRLSRLLGQSSALKPHTFIPRDILLKDVAPQLRDSEGLQGAFQYYDGQFTYPDRLEIESLQDAMSEKKRPVDIIRHAEVTNRQIEPGNSGVLVTFRDEIENQAYTVRTRYVVNATGPDVDKVDETLSSQKPSFAMKPQKGEHILADNTIGLRSTVYSLSPEDKRPFFVIPFPINSPDEIPPYLLIGTTDEKNPASLDPSATGVDYLIRSANQVLPSLRLTHEAVKSANAAVRPTEKSDAQTPGQVPRSHRIVVDASKRVFSIVGGKLTTQRPVAVEVADQVLKRLGNPTPSPTATRSYPGSVGLNEDFEAFKEVSHSLDATYNLDPEVSEQLMNRYGNQYWQVFTIDKTVSGFWKRLSPSLPMVKAQVVYALRKEYAETLTDIMTNSLQLDLVPPPPEELDTAIASVMSVLAVEKQLTPEEQAQEIRDYKAFLARRNAWKGH